jgi:opacity protein-like surface antigen
MQLINLPSFTSSSACFRVHPRHLSAFMISALLCAAFFVSASVDCRAQTASGGGGASQAPSWDSGFEGMRNEFGLWGGSSFALPSAVPGTRDRSIPLLVGLRYGRVLFTGKALAFELTFDIVPVALVCNPSGRPIAPPPGSTGREYVYGAGFVPLGFKLYLAPEHRVKPYVTASSGAFYFTKQIPVPDSAQFNFLSTAGAGVQVFLSARHAVNIEYRIGHLSNADIGKLNPGFNSSVILVGFSIYK